jgi:hypothetical protein
VRRSTFRPDSVVVRVMRSSNMVVVRMGLLGCGVKSDE